MKTRSSRRPWWVLAAGVCLGLTSACPGGIDDPQDFFNFDGGGGGDGGTDGGCDAPSLIFTPTCGVCHHPQPGELGQLDLTSPGLNSRLVGVGSAGCGSGHVLVVAGQPDASYLFMKVVNAAPSCGTQMPQGSQLTPDQLQCVSSWITALGSN